MLFEEIWNGINHFSYSLISIQMYREMNTHLLVMLTCLHQKIIFHVIQ